MELLVSDGLSDCYAAAHAILCLESIAVIIERKKLKEQGKLTLLPPFSQTAADQSYIDTAERLFEGLKNWMKLCYGSEDSLKKRLYEIWKKSEADA